MHRQNGIKCHSAWAIALLLCLPIMLLAVQELEWVPLDPSASSADLNIRLVESSGTRSVLEITLPGFYQTTIEQEGVTYQKLILEENLAGLQIGHPDLPVLTTLIGLPATGTVSARVTYMEGETFTDYRVYPFQEPLQDAQNQSPFTIDQAVYQQNRAMPESMVSLDGPHIWRDCRIVSVRITPFQYNPATGVLQAFRKMRVEVTATPGAGPNPLEGDHHRVSPKFDKMYSAALLNYSQLGYEVMQTDEPNIKYLIITNTPAVSHLQSLVDFRTAQGYPVEVRTITAPDFDDPIEFKYYILTLYEEQGLEYVLMVGDAGTGDHNVPLYWWNPDGSDGSYSDSWYSCLVPWGDDDHYAEIAIGRIVYDNLDELDDQIDKLMNYLTNPDNSTNWAEHTLLVAHEEQYPLKYTQCKNQIAAYTYSVQTAIFDSVYGGNGGTNTDVVNYINNTACGILNYRGHGSATEWWQWGPSGSLTVIHINQMTNVNPTNGSSRLFVHFDVCCDNMDIINHPGDCLAESFMKADYAAVAINSAIIPSYTIPNHDYDKEMYKAVYDEGINNIGYVTNFANVVVLNGHGTLGRSNARTYLWLGDACIDVWTDTPQVLTVTHQPVHLIGLDTYNVDVFQGGSPVEDAMVCAQNGEVCAVGWTNAAGHVTLEFEEAPVIPADMNLTVTGHNCIPYEAIVAIIPPSGPYVIYEGHTLNDAAGNNDGLADYGESILLSLDMANVGLDPANGVTVTVSTDDPYITITDDSEFAGDIAADTTVTLTDGFAFDVSSDAPDQHWVLIDVTAEDSTDTIWESSFAIQLHATIITILSLEVDDVVGGNGNGKLDPGELADITVTLSNDGSSNASNVSATMTTDYLHLVVNQGAASLDTLTALGTAALTPDFELQLAHACPDPSRAIIYVELTGDNGLQKYLLYDLSLGGFFDDIESGQGSWTHVAATPGWADDWHISTEDYSSPTHAWKCGDTGTGNYSDHMDAGLVMPALDLPLGCELHFNHWMDAEISSFYPDSAYDGGIIEISVGGGAWAQLIPEGGYNQHIRCETGGGSPYTGPFEGGIPCFSGSIDWTPVVVDLSSYSGSLQLRFRFGSDQGTGAEGWYIDDVDLVFQGVMDPPDNLEADLTGDIVTLTWNSPGASGMIASLLSYNVYREGEMIDSMICNLTCQDDLTGMPLGFYEYYVTAMYDQGESGPSDTVVVDYGGTSVSLESDELIPNDFVLEQNYPNPFNPTTIIRFGLPQQSKVTLKVYNVLGREVATLVDQVRPAGYHLVHWNAGHLASGFYFTRMEAGSKVLLNKMLLVK